MQRTALRSCLWCEEKSLVNPTAAAALPSCGAAGVFSPVVLQRAVAPSFYVIPLCLVAQALL